MKTILVFQSSAFDPEPKDAPKPAGRDCAEYVMKQLLRQGLSFAYATPIEGDAGWFLYPELKGVKYELVIQWATALESKEDYWFISIKVWRSWLASLFGKRASNSDVDVIRLVIHELFLAEEHTGLVRNLMWLTQDEFVRSFAA
jgi:hypothetical protein